MCVLGTIVAADSTFEVRFKVHVSEQEDEATFVVRVHPEWAPIGAARFRDIVNQGIFDQARFFRVVSGFMVQWGIPADPRVAAVWRNAKIIDDPVKVSNKKGYVTFATSGKNSRTTQMFVNFVDNAFLDSQGFAPFAEIVEGMDVVERLYSGYGEGRPSGHGPEQGRIQSEGNEYLERDFPLMSYIDSTTVEGASADMHSDHSSKPHMNHLTQNAKSRRELDRDLGIMGLPE